MWWDELNDAGFTPELRFRRPDKQPDFYYNSITSRFAILNALSGKPYLNDKKQSYRMGSFDERRFYTIVMGEPTNPKETIKLFFDSPEQFEHATGIVVAHVNKKRFMERRDTYLKSI